MKTSPPPNRGDKHFLDSSAARPLLLASSKYRAHLKAQFGDRPQYISIYVQMEIRRSFLRAAIAFHAILQMPTILSVYDALSLWSNQFKSSRLRAVPPIIYGIMEAHSIDPKSPKDKKKVSTALANYIIRFESKLRRSFTDPGQDTTRCARAVVPLRFYADDISRGLQEFAEQFDDTKQCRANCSIDHVLLRRHQGEVKEFVRLAQSTANNDETRGFLGVAKNLATILQKGSAACSCRRCETIGDALIALEAPRQMLLEHLDNSFNQLCPPINQRHRQHQSEIAFHREASKLAP